ncbi:hypothetical protein ABNG03_10180 [Halorubrum sp. RMP-47]|uniref:Ribbon-helix-helix protein CopG domain-containing protein n=1 Tax=Halorubrum miltondacostae TaxID=3076378 RepID=A0ABD5LYR4_9EURY
MTENTRKHSIAKKFTLTAHHDELLDKIVEQRYASRSEAVRAAVQQHAQYLSEGGETDIELLQAELEKVAKEIDTVRQKVEEQNSNTIHVAGQVSDRVEVEEHSRRESEIENKIVKELTEEGPLSASEIAEGIGRDAISVVPVAKSLHEEGIISQVSDSDDKYKLDI